MNLETQVVQGGLAQNSVTIYESDRVLASIENYFAPGTIHTVSFSELLLTGDGDLTIKLGDTSASLSTCFSNVQADYTPVLVDAVQKDDYFPFGLTFNHYESTPPENQYKYNGKEEQKEWGVIDYGARMYQADLGRWFNLDELAEKYYHASPFIYTLNNPINAVDPDGRVVIFVNGMHWKGEGGKKEYWGKDGRIADKIKEKIGEKSEMYYDGSSGGAWTPVSVFSGFRKSAGKTKALKDAKAIFENLEEGETIKFVTHSMGAAYAKGFIKGLKKYAKKNNIDMTNLIEFEVDIAPFQPYLQKAEEGVPTTTVSDGGDIVAGSDPMQNAEPHVLRAEDSHNFSIEKHLLPNFEEDVLKFIPKSTKNSSKTFIYEEKDESKTEDKE